MAAAAISDDDDQSISNLSERLRRGSNDSQDTFYMDLDRGIDSDIEDLVSGASAVKPVVTFANSVPKRESTASSSEGSSGSYLEGEYPGPTQADWAGLDPPETPPESPEVALGAESKLLIEPPVPSVTEPFLVIEPTVTRPAPPINAYPVNGVCLPPGPDIENEAVRISEDSGLGTIHSPLQKRPLPLQFELPNSALSRCSSYAGSIASQPTTTNGKKDPLQIQAENDALIMVLSAFYAKMIIIMGISFPLAEVISHKIPMSYYEGFYMYLYMGSISFLVYVYIFLIRKESDLSSRTSSYVRSFLRKVTIRLSPSAMSLEQPQFSPVPVRKKVYDDGHHCGSFYLRLGAVAFGIGSMIYSGLEFGQFFELESDSHCYNILYGLSPSSRMLFTFIQLYFIFLNTRVSIKKHKPLARFGMMHIIATNLCVWLHVLVQETKHQILTLINPNQTNLIPAFVLEAKSIKEEDLAHELAHHHISERSIDHTVYISHECRRSNIMGELVQDASQFLFPCTIEYSLICAAIMYVMWKNIGKGQYRIITDSSSLNNPNFMRQRHYYQVDCAKANKGLFTGILVLVFSIISLIIFFVLINKHQYKDLAILQAHIAELVLYILTTLAVVIALIQVSELRYSAHRTVELDSILLIVGQSGLYLFTMFSVIGGHFTMDKNTVLVLLTGIAGIIQGTLQTIFILNASCRYAGTSSQARRKPGREMVTFLLVCNFAMWAINTLETRRADSNPIQMEFYGFWAWTIITHVTTPLTIFFRFHSTVCLCDIWKKTYKVRSEYV